PAGASNPGAGAGLASHPVPERGRVRQAGRDNIARGHAYVADPDRLGAVKAELVQRLQDADELLAEPVLERHPPRRHPSRDQQHLLVLHIDTLDRPDSFWELKDLRLREGRGGEPTALRLPDDRWVEALFDRGPDRERGGEVVPGDDEVGPVAHADLVDRSEEMVGRVTCEHIGQSWLNT